MKNFSLPTVDHPVALISHGTTLIIERNKSSIEEYSVTGIPGFKINHLSRESILDSAKVWAEKGYEVK